MQPICPGRNPNRYPLIRTKTDFGGSSSDPSENCGLINQPNELYGKNDDADLGMSENILHYALLSGRIYKICT